MDIVEDKIDCLRITKSRLEGSIKVSGAKNSVLKLQTASILTDEDVHILNYPSTLLDAKIHEKMLCAIGKECTVEGGTLLVKENKMLTTSLEWSGRSIRNALLILGALVTRFGEGKVPLPGGCKLGERKYDLHIMLLERLGAKVWEDDQYLYATSRSEKLKGAEIHLPIRSTGATENAIIAGSLAEGTTIIWNPHIRPEIIDLISMLCEMGAKISVFGQEKIEITGVERLHGTTYSTIPDNMEAMTYLVATAVTKGEVEIVDFPTHHLEVPLAFLRESGAKIYQCKNSVIIKNCTPYPLSISTGPYPGINSDMQPILAMYGLAAKGSSQIVDLRFAGRYGYMSELNKMGAQSSVRNNTLYIEGGFRLTGTSVTAVDLRAGAALMIAGMIADDETVISNAWQIERGYDQIIKKLQCLGCNLSVES